MGKFTEKHLRSMKIIQVFHVQPAFQVCCNGLNNPVRVRGTAGNIDHRQPVITSYSIHYTKLYETWCRYVCPLGQMVATFARASIVEVRANYNYCSHECTSFDCYAGRDDIPGCSMGKGPFAMTTNQDCVLCGNCMKACKNAASYNFV